MAEDNIPPTPPGFRPAAALGLWWRTSTKLLRAAGATPANDEELQRLRAEQASDNNNSGDDVENRLRAEYQDVIAQSMSRIKEAANADQGDEGEARPGGGEYDALRKRNAALETAAAEEEARRAGNRKPSRRRPLRQSSPTRRRRRRRAPRGVRVAAGRGAPPPSCPRRWA